MYSLENLARIWNDNTGECIEVGPDNDGLDLLEIRAYTDKKKLTGSITLTSEQAKLVAEALVKQAFGQNFCIKEEE